MRVLIHTHIFCRLLVEGNAPKFLLNTEFTSLHTIYSSLLRSHNRKVMFWGIGETPQQAVLQEGSIRESSKRVNLSKFTLLATL